MGTEGFAEAIERGVRAHQAGRLDEAASSYRNALSIAPEDGEATSLLGLALLHDGRTEEALPLLQRGVEREPMQAGLRINLAEGLIRANRLEEALEEAERATLLNAGAVRAWRIARDICVALSDWRRLELIAVRWCEAQATQPEPWRALARSAFEQGRYLTACNAYQRAMGAPPDADDLAVYASLCLHALRFEEAAEALARAASADPQHASALATRALLHMYLGRFDEAEADCVRSLAIDPGQGAAYSTLSRLRRGRLDDAELGAALRIAQGEEVHLDRRIPAAYAAAHAYDARDELDRALSAYEYAHDLARERDRREGRAYDAEAVERRVQRIMEAAGRGVELEDAEGRPTPIFIVGMPRSGTTLLESVLGAHSRVFACGERVIMRQLLQLELESSSTPAQRATWRDAYFADLPELRGATHVTDKHPLNFEAVGLIHALFPAAAIIHVRRDPLETAWSIYRQEFTKLWTFAHRFEDIAHYFGCCSRLSAYWERTLSERYTVIRYEDFVASFATAARELVAKCGLPWEDRCLTFQQQPRAIATFSAVQARAPVELSRSAVRYGARLAPLERALEAAGVDLQTGRCDRPAKSG